MAFAELEVRGGGFGGYTASPSPYGGSGFSELGVDSSWLDSQQSPQLAMGMAGTQTQMMAETCKLCRGTAMGHKKSKPCASPHCRNGRVWITPYTGQQYTYAPHDHRPFSNFHFSAISASLI
eukprot:TRINITY_DN67927_c4_g1_i1.p1 TRINITY_DN67927_c4_g1~~TRINITY_DN67927_c4_g1_i1.p1  ORF type:complete len:122 (+),score=11.06 TRINITY_DN67927_c4_g1_i1:44-409(+)